VSPPSALIMQIYSSELESDSGQTCERAQRLLVPMAGRMVVWILLMGGPGSPSRRNLLVRNWGETQLCSSWMETAPRRKTRPST
jgi:hypothetical protein